MRRLFFCCKRNYSPQHPAEIQIEHQNTEEVNIGSQKNFKNPFQEKRFFDELRTRFQQISSLIISISKIPTKTQEISDALTYLENLRQNYISLYHNPCNLKEIKFILRTEFNASKYFSLLSRELPIDISEIFPCVIKNLPIDTPLGLAKIISEDFDLFLISHKKRIHSIAITNAIDLIITAGNDSYIRIWSIRKQRQVRAVDLRCKKILAMVLTHDNHYLITSGADCITKVWIFPSLNLISEIFPTRYKCSLLVSTWNSKYLVAVDCGISLKIWDLQARANYADLRGAGSILSLTVSQNDEFLASAGSLNLITVWDIKKKAIKYSLNGSAYNIKTLAFSKDAKYLATAGGGKMITLWNLDKRAEVSKIEGVKSCVFAMAFINNDTQIITAGDDCYFGLWDLNENGYCYINHKISPFTRAMAITNDGEYLAFAGRGNNVEMWSIKENRVVLKMQNCLGPLSNLGISVDRRYVIAVCNLNEIKAFRLNDKKEVYTMERNAAAILSLSAKSGLKYIVTAERNRCYWVWMTSVLN